MSSTRLPGKVLKEVMGKPLLLWLIQRIESSKYVEQVVVATSDDESDDPIVELLKEKGVTCIRGSLTDVLDRYYTAANECQASTIIRLTADCPLMDPEILDLMVLNYKLNDCDYIANTVPTETSTFPDGMDVEIFSLKALEKSWREAKKPSEREHVTFYMWKNPEKFKIHQFCLNHNWSKYRITVDYPEDLDLINKIITSLFPINPNFGIKEIVDFLIQNEDARALNQDITPNLGWQSSLEKDMEIEHE